MDGSLDGKGTVQAVRFVNISHRGDLSAGEAEGRGVCAGKLCSRGAVALKPTALELPDNPGGKSPGVGGDELWNIHRNGLAVGIAKRFLAPLGPLAELNPSVSTTNGPNQSPSSNRSRRNLAQANILREESRGRRFVSMGALLGNKLCSVQKTAAAGKKT